MHILISLYVNLQKWRILYQEQTVVMRAHHSKSHIFVQKFNFDQNPTIFTTFSPKFFLTIFLVKSKLSTAKKSKTTTFSRVFHHPKNRQFSREIKVEFLDKKMKIPNRKEGKRLDNKVKKDVTCDEKICKLYTNAP